MLDFDSIADALLEGKCSYCRGYKFLRGGYPCPQCKGTGMTGSRLSTGRSFNTVKDAMDDIFGGRYWSEPILKDIGHVGPVYFLSDAINSGNVNEVRAAFDQMIADGNLKWSGTPEVRYSSDSVGRDPTSNFISYDDAAKGGGEVWVICPKAD